MNTTCSLSNFISGKYTKNIMEILNTVPGYISIIYQNQSLLNPKDSEEIQTHISMGRFNSQIHSLFGD